MKKLLAMSLLVAYGTSTLYAGGTITKEKMIAEAISEVKAVENTTSMLNGFFSSYGIGGSKITLGDEYHKAFSITSKAGYKFANDVSVYMLGESNYYRHVGDIHDMGISGLGLGYDIPYTNHKISVGAAAGIGMSLNYNRVFKKFSESYDFGFAYRANVSYQITKNFAFNVSYSKFDFNTNATKLEDTQPEIVGVNFSYNFDTKSLLD